MNATRTPVLPSASWSVSAPGGQSLGVLAPNWLAALAIGLATLGRSLPAAGVVVETLGNGTVIARDLALGHRYVVRPVAPAVAEVEPEPEVEIAVVPVLAEPSAPGAVTIEPV